MGDGEQSSCQAVKLMVGFRKRGGGKVHEIKGGEKKNMQEIRTD